MVPVNRVEYVQKGGLVLGLDVAALHVIHDLRETFGCAHERGSAMRRRDGADFGGAHWYIWMSSVGLTVGEI